MLLAPKVSATGGHAPRRLWTSTEGCSLGSDQAKAIIISLYTFQSHRFSPSIWCFSTPKGIIGQLRLPQFKTVRILTNLTANRKSAHLAFDSLSSGYAFVQFFSLCILLSCCQLTLLRSNPDVLTKFTPLLFSGCTPGPSRPAQRSIDLGIVSLLSFPYTIR